MATIMLSSMATLNLKKQDYGFDRAFRLRQIHVLRSLNRMNDKVANVTGKIWYRGVDINAKDINVYEVRKHIGMVFQRPNPFAKSIRENITYALKANGLTDKEELDKRVEESLKQAALWDEVKDELDKSAFALSGGQAQRLCIARCCAMKPDIMLLDEPASALDPISTSKIEDTLEQLRKKYSIIIVTHNMQQASESVTTLHFPPGTRD